MIAPAAAGNAAAVPELALVFGGCGIDVCVQIGHVARLTSGIRHHWRRTADERVSLAVTGRVANVD